MRLVVRALLLLGFAASTAGACSSKQQDAPLCQPSQRVRCNDCPSTGACAGVVCSGWIQCSADGTAFVGSCSECAPPASTSGPDTGAPPTAACASLSACCQTPGYPAKVVTACNALAASGSLSACAASLDLYCLGASDGGCEGAACGPTDAQAPDASARDSTVVDSEAREASPPDAGIDASHADDAAHTLDAAATTDAPSHHDAASQDAGGCVYAAPGTFSLCTCSAPNPDDCQANGCYNGYYCDTVTFKCSKTGC
jgi:hypothetical protein